MNLRVSHTYESVIQEVQNTILNTDDWNLHHTLAERFEQSGIPNVAQEIRTSHTPLPTPIITPPMTKSVLGSQTQTLEYWENIIKEKPDYRDAYLAGAKIALTQNNVNEALDLTKRALLIDPNDKTALVLLTLLEKNIKK